MGSTRRSKGSPAGGQFASPDRARDVCIDDVLVLPSRNDYSEESLIRRVHETTSRMEQARDACEGKHSGSPEWRDVVVLWLDAVEAHCDMYEAGYRPAASAMLLNMFTADRNQWIEDHNLYEIDFERASELGPRAQAVTAPAIDVLNRLRLGIAKELARTEKRASAKR